MIVAMTSCGRPEYLRRTLESWSRVRGLERMVVSMEPGYPHCADLCARYPFIEVVANATNLGVVANSKQALELGFARDDFAVYSDDDVLVSTDVLEYFAWVRDTFASDNGVVCACAYMAETQRSEAETFLAPWFDSLTWGTWADRWPWISERWGGVERNALAYDLRLANEIQASALKAVFPCQARADDAGAFGVHSRPGLIGRGKSKCFTEDRPPQEYRLAD